MPAEYNSEGANTEELQIIKREIYVSAISAFNPMQIMDHWSSPKGELKVLLTRLVNADVLSRQSFHATSAVSSTKDPYTALGLDKSASLSDIKKAYYAMAKKYHPDTNKDPKAKDRFSESQTAYQMLSDPKKKEAWDRYGSAAFDQGAGFDPGAETGPFGGAAGGSGFRGGFGGGFGAEINIEDLFGAFTGQGRRARGSRQSPFQEDVLVGQDIEVQANISFMDAAMGTSKNINITPKVKCRTCSGGGLKSGKSRSSCKSCGGSGTRVHFAQQGFQMASTCNACGGAGVVVPRGAECGTCNGVGITRERKAVPVNIPGGVEDGMRIQVSGEGDAPHTGTAVNPETRSIRGDLLVIIRVAPDSKFSRSGADVLYTASIPLTTAALGGEIKIPTLEGEAKVKVATGTGTGDVLTLSGKGMPKIGGRRNASGDLKVEFKVTMPKYLDSNQRTILEMLADELGDLTAKRLMNVGRASDHPQKFRAKSPAKSSTKPPATSPALKTDAPQASTMPDLHKNEGFLKSAWYKLIHQYDDQAPEVPSGEKRFEEKVDEEEPKKAAGSG